VINLRQELEKDRKLFELLIHCLNLQWPIFLGIIWPLVYMLPVLLFVALLFGN
jgi:hypothetical protein